MSLISGTSYLTVTLRGEKVTLENSKLVGGDKIVQLMSLSIEQYILYETYILEYQSDRSLNLCGTVFDKIFESDRRRGGARERWSSYRLLPLFFLFLYSEISTRFG